MQHYVDTLPAMIHIMSEDPDGLKGVNVEKMQRAGAARGLAFKPYEGRHGQQIPVDHRCRASKKWAKKVFPGERTSAAAEKLWEAILNTVRVSEDNDPMAEWNDHDASLKEYCRRLNELDLDYLHYQAPNGTDFKCWLIPGAQWHGGGRHLARRHVLRPQYAHRRGVHLPHAGPLRGDPGFHHAPVLPGELD